MAVEDRPGTRYPVPTEQEIRSVQEAINWSHGLKGFYTASVDLSVHIGKSPQCLHREKSGRQFYEE